MIEQIEAVDQQSEVRTNGVKFALEEVRSSRLSIKVIGVGGCGSNIIDNMIDAGLSGVDFICLNTDEQALKRCKAPTRLQLGERLTQGYGTGSDPEVGREAALQNTEELTEVLGNADMVFLATGLGGGTGTGATPIVALLAKQMGALTVAAAVKPFAFEGKRRSQIAEDGLQALMEQTDTTIIVPNARLLEQSEAARGFFDGFRMADNAVLQALQGITDIIMKPGIMNCDFADIRAILRGAGLAVIGSSERGGRDAATQAARDALASPMMEHTGLSKATKLLVNITGSGQFGMQDANEALNMIHREVQPNAELIVGSVRDDSMGEQVRVVVIASGFEEDDFSLQPQPEANDFIASDVPLGEPTAWEAENVVELLEDDQPPEAAAEEAVVEPNGGYAEEAPPEEEPEDLAPVEPPREYMPPPNIRAEEDGFEAEPRRPTFFRRFAMFR